MDTSDRLGARACGAAALLVAALVCGCGSQPTPSPVPTPAPAAPTATSVAAATPVAYADTLRIGVVGGTCGSNASSLGDFRGWWECVEFGAGLNGSALTFGHLVYAGLYRLDGRYDPVPDLADGPCFVPGTDGRILRCRIREATFQDGTPVTADDVAYTYELFHRPFMGPGYTVTGSLEEVRVVDPRTVDFQLSSVDATFVTDVLALLPILPRQAIDAAVAEFDARTKGLEPAELVELTDAINRETNAEPPVCSPDRVAEVDALYQRLGADILFHEDQLSANGTFDACGWLSLAALNLGALDSDGGGAAYILQTTGIDRAAGVAAWYLGFRPGFLPGAGPYRYVSQGAAAVHFEAWPGYHGGVAATKHVDAVRARTDGSDIGAGTLDVIPGIDLGVDFRATAASRGVTIATSLPPGQVYSLIFNVRPGRVFADANLRRALQLCIDLPRDVDATTAGAGTAVYSPVLPGTDAYAPDLPKPARDVAAAEKLIEASGWSLGADGVYAKGSLRLSVQLPVRLSDQERVAMSDLIAHQARDCGMDLHTIGLEDNPWTSMLSTFPHEVPGTNTPFDLAIVKWYAARDPGDILTALTTSQATTEDDSSGGNMGGFSDPDFDRLVAAGAATYDQAERARIYREAQEELAAQEPVLWLWGYPTYDSVRAAVATVGGPLDLSVPNWAWAPEKLVVKADP